MTTGIETVQIRLANHAYDILIGSGLSNEIARRLRGLNNARRATVITDSRVGPLYGDALLSALQRGGFNPAMLEIPGGEDSKTLCMAAELYDALAELQHRRDEPIIALGGGVVGDVAGFVAATWHRGVPFVQCPTTLEADIDAAIGGKTAVNHASGKNLVGAFHQPLFVAIDLDYLASLPQREYIAGLAESIKHGVSLDPEFLEWHHQNAKPILHREPAALTYLVKRNCELKASVVMSDVHELDKSGVGRAALNYGHTAGHALEAESDFELRHGEAVALGMVVALDLAVRELGLPDADRLRVESVISQLHLPARLNQDMDINGLLARMSTDKKNESTAGGPTPDPSIRFVLTPKLGELSWFSAKPEMIERGLSRLNAR